MLKIINVEETVFADLSEPNFFKFGSNKPIAIDGIVYNVPHKLDREIRCEISFRK